MTDIVERLRRKVFRGPTMEAGHTRTVEWQAADEIERLRKDLSLAVFADNEYWQVLEKENERLRAALHRIGLPRAKIFYCRDGHEEAVLIARAALGGKHD